MITINGIDEVREHVGHDLGVSPWHEVTQEAVNDFANATEDCQWIHVDPERAKSSPFGGTIAHGLYTLSLWPKFSLEMFSMEGFAFGMNYGYNRVRFMSPVPTGSKIRMRAVLTSAEEVSGGMQIVITATFEREGSDKPVCVAEMVTRLYTG